jgi:chromosome partitioning protein
MKTVALISAKGGPGKSTLAVHLATASHLLGLTSGIIDLDKQCSASKWFGRRGASPFVASNHAQLLPSMLEAAEKNDAGIVYIDTAGHASDDSALIASRHADLILIPIRPAVFDIEAITPTYELAKLARRKVRAVFNGVAPRTESKVRQAEEGLAAMGLEALPIHVHTRALFADSLIDGRTAMEIEPGGKAAKEIMSLMKWISEDLGLGITFPKNNRFTASPLDRVAA